MILAAFTSYPGLLVFRCVFIFLSLGRFTHHLALFWVRSKRPLLLRKSNAMGAGSD